MFSWSEILLIAVVALIFIGPRELPAVLHKLGQATAKLKRSADEFRRHFEESMRESGYDDLHKNLNDLRSLNPSSQLRATIDSAINQSYAPMSQPVGTQPSAPPSFATAPLAPGSITPLGDVPAAAAFEMGTPADKAAEVATPVVQPGAAARGAQEAAVEPSKDHAAPVA
jgi:sec-independent protein translocase protein TatB